MNRAQLTCLMESDLQENIQFLDDVASSLRAAKKARRSERLAAAGPGFSGDLVTASRVTPPQVDSSNIPKKQPYRTPEKAKQDFSRRRRKMNYRIKTAVAREQHLSRKRSEEALQAQHNAQMHMDAVRDVVSDKAAQAKQAVKDKVNEKFGNIGEHLTTAGKVAGGLAVGAGGLYALSRGLKYIRHAKPIMGALTSATSPARKSRRPKSWFKNDADVSNALKAAGGAGLAYYMLKPRSHKRNHED